MNKELIDKTWKILPKDFKEEVKHEYRNTIINEVRSVLESFFGKHNLTSDEEPEVRCVINRTNVEALHSEIHKTIMDAHDADDWQDAAHYVLDLLPRSFNNLFGSKCLPDKEYTTCVHASGIACVNYDKEHQRCSLHGECKFSLPVEVAHEDNFASKEPKSDDMEENRNLSQSSSNCDKSEEKELNLREILKDHIGKMLFSPIIGNCNVQSISKEYIYVTYVNNLSYCFGMDGRREKNGICMLYPSVESYCQYPLDAHAAWQEFIEANKPKVELRVSYTIKEKIFNGSGSFSLMFNSQEEAQQAAEAVKKCLEEFHSKHNQQ